MGLRGIYSLRSTFSLCGMHSGCQTRKYLVKHRWIPTASADYIFPSTPRIGFRRDERLREVYRPVRRTAGPDCLTLKGGEEPCLGYYVHSESYSIADRKHVVAATGSPSHLMMETVSGRERPWSGVRSSTQSLQSPRLSLSTPKSASGPRNNTFRPDSPLTITCQRGLKTHTHSSPHRTMDVPVRVLLTQLIVQSVCYKVISNRKYT